MAVGWLAKLNHPWKRQKKDKAIAREKMGIFGKWFYAAPAQPCDGKEPFVAVRNRVLLRGKGQTVVLCLHRE